MGRKTVRAAIAQYLEGAGIEYLSKVFPYPPKFTEGGDFYASSDPGHQAGAVIYLHLAHQVENREAIGGVANGTKFRPFTVALICVFRSKDPDTQNVGEQNDDFLDSLVSAIEKNRNAGNPQVIFQWGEGRNLYGEDIKVRAEMPRTFRQQMSQVFSVVEVTALEILNT